MRKYPKHKILSLSLSVLSVLILCAGMVYLQGCGKPRQEEEATEMEMPPAEEQPPATTPATPGESTGGGGTNGGGGTSGEGKGGESHYSFNPQSIGSSSGPGYPLVIQDVRWADQGDYYRVVFEIKKSDGTDTTYLPFSQTSGTSSSSRKIQFLIMGVGVNDPQFLNIGDQVSLGDPVVSSIKRVEGGGSLETSFVINLTTPRKHYLHYSTGPMRVILDIQKT